MASVAVLAYSGNTTMNNGRRRFLKMAGLTAAAAAPGLLVLPAGAAATPASGEPDAMAKALLAQLSSSPANGGWTATEKNIPGPFYRPRALYRAKVTPPLEPGRLLVVSGRVWGLDTKKPLSMAILDVWQANEQGRYDNDDPKNPPKPDVFENRARMVTDEVGRYEYETIHPGRYLNGAEYRPEHIHYMVQAPGYKTLITQLYFDGDPHNATDPFIKSSLIMKVVPVKARGTTYDTVTFDIVLDPK